MGKTFFVSLFVLSGLFLHGVFGDSSSLMEGDSVTLHTKVTESENDVIVWRFTGGIKIARLNREANTTKTDYTESFKGRLTLDNKTGDLTIRNTRLTDSGGYEASNNNNHVRNFSVGVVSAGSVRSVMEGGSLTLTTGIYVEEIDEIEWSFGEENTSVARINKTAGIFNTSDGPDKLHLDNQTGSLTIEKISSSLSGVYRVSIGNSSISIQRTYTVTVSGKLKSFLLVEEGESVDLNSGLTEIQTDDVIQWKFGGIPIAEIEKAVQEFPKIKDEIRLRDTLKLDNQTGSLTITDTRSTDSGEYTLQIRSRKFTINERFNVTVTASCKITLYNPWMYATIVLSILIFLMFLMLVISLYCYIKARHQYLYNFDPPAVPVEVPLRQKTLKSEKELIGDEYL